jgi:hypothetical protein
MAFLKYAKATVQKPGIKFAEWDALRRKALSPAPDFQQRTARVILQEYDPSKYMLSHATIVASVDVEPASAPLGKHYVDGFQIDRRYQDYYITPKTAQFVNNNNDSFERKLLLASFKTFIGAYSYVEHVQLPELSKGRIIDAAARDVGDSVYVDILIANELKHAPLIRAIKSGQLGTLSMGCSTSDTTCSKCGNVASDETQLCACIRFFKGSEFKDELGNKRKVAELCGHFTSPESVRFIEASWVANPAFKGAVIRNILSAQELQSVETKVRMAFALPAPVADPNAMQKAARDLSLFRMSAQDEEAPAQPDAEAPAQPDAQAKPDEDPLHKAVKDLATVLKDQAVEHVRKEINQSEAGKVRENVDPNKENESLIRSAMQLPQWRKVAKLVISFVGKAEARKVLHGLILYKSGGWGSVRTAGMTGKQILAVSRVLDLMTKKSSMAGETRVYRTVLNVGGTGPYEDEETYLAACRQVMGRRLTGNESGSLIEKGRLYALGRSS